jgi:hypothetical protein
MATRTTVSEIKYGKTIRTSPQTSGTAAFCFLPYKKKPNPNEPNSKLQRREAVLNAASHIV